MNLPDDTKLDYIVSREAWYGLKGGRPELNIRAASDEGGCAWEFMIEEYEFSAVDSGRTAVQLMMFGDAFDAFADIPELFELMRERQPKSLNDVRHILDRLGAVDSTERVSPYAKPAVKAGDVVTSTSEMDALPSGTAAELAGGYLARKNHSEWLVLGGVEPLSSPLRDCWVPARILDVLGR